MHTVDTDAHVTVVTIVETVETHEDSRDERMCRIPVRPPRARSLRSGVTPLTFGGSGVHATRNAQSDADCSGSVTLIGTAVARPVA